MYHNLKNFSSLSGKKKEEEEEVDEMNLRICE